MCHHVNSYVIEADVNLGSLGVTRLIHDNQFETLPVLWSQMWGQRGLTLAGYDICDDVQ